MISMPYQDIIQKIKEEKGISDEDLSIRIKKKMDQLSGLISKEGAAYIVANDLGVKLIQTSGLIKIKNILQGMRTVETAGKVMRKFNVIEFEREGKKGKVGSFMIADETGQIRVTAWHDQTAILDKFSEGDIVRISNAMLRLNQGQKELHLNERSKVIVNPPDVKIDGVSAPVARPEQVRKRISELAEQDQNVEVFGTVVQVYDPRFFEQCPKCRKRPVQRDDGFMCEEHGAITPTYGYVVNIILDDGTDTMRVVMFREQMQQLFGKGDTELLALRAVAGGFEPQKTELLGEQIVISGRIVKNNMFDRLEMIANKVDRNVSPQAEIKRLEKENIAPKEKIPSIDDI
jgi:replication factor A1